MSTCQVSWSKQIENADKMLKLWNFRNMQENHEKQNLAKLSYFTYWLFLSRFAGLGPMCHAMDKLNIQNDEHVSLMLNIFEN